MQKAHLYSEEQISSESSSFIVKVYGWMSLALAITGVVAWWTANTPEMLDVILGNRIVFYILLVAELILVASLAAWVMKMSSQTAMIIFILYSVLNGLTFSVIFLAYTKESIATTFFICGGMFAIMSAYGYLTKSDLSKWGNILFMALIGLILASVINIFFNSETLHWITTFAGILIFTGLTAYDTQKIKNLNIIGNEGTEEDKKEAITGALTLYLDFINLFLMLLRIFGKKK